MTEDEVRQLAIEAYDDFCDSSTGYPPMQAAWDSYQQKYGNIEINSIEEEFFIELINYGVLAAVINRGELIVNNNKLEDVKKHPINSEDVIDAIDLSALFEVSDVRIMVYVLDRTISFYFSNPDKMADIKYLLKKTFDKHGIFIAVTPARVINVSISEISKIMPLAELLKEGLLDKGYNVEFTASDRKLDELKDPAESFSLPLDSSD